MPMCPTRADGKIFSMPSRMPPPARKMLTMTTFLPSSSGASIEASGVSMGVGTRGRSRVTS
jgi:hypothetical protein